jgi:hypothetical protein
MFTSYARDAESGLEEGWLRDRWAKTGKLDDPWRST